MEVISATYSRLLFPTLVPNTAWPSKAIGRSSEEFHQKDQTRRQIRLLAAFESTKTLFLPYAEEAIVVFLNSKKWQDNVITYDYYSEYEAQQLNCAWS